MMGTPVAAAQHARAVSASTAVAPVTARGLTRDDTASARGPSERPRRRPGLQPPGASASASHERCRTAHRPGVRIVCLVRETTLHRHGGFEHSHVTRVRIAIGCGVGGVHRCALHGHGHGHAGTATATGSSTTRSSVPAKACEPSPFRSRCSRSRPCCRASCSSLPGSVALLADLIHNGGDALTAIPLGIAFAMRSRRAEGTRAWPSSRRSSSRPWSPGPNRSVASSIPARRLTSGPRRRRSGRLPGQLDRRADPHACRSSP